MDKLAKAKFFLSFNQRNFRFYQFKSLNVKTLRNLEDLSQNRYTTTQNANEVR
jgi:hypothetical protein